MWFLFALLEKINTVHAYCCENGHSYDVSAQGYVHLLPPNKMHSKIPEITVKWLRAAENFGNRSLPSVQ
ncbi:MAG: putative RNA methyltransferase [Acutalibacteraceae bacterium]